jgi:pimeloyl-ACP methyl ester carboxylesterase
MVPGSFGETFVRISGPCGAPPLILLPGLNTTSLFWAPNIAALSAGYRTCALERIGDVGRSRCTRPIASAAELMRWLDETFTALDPGRRINLLGLSYGGWLAAQYALAFPNRVQKLVLVAPGGALPTNLRFYLRAIPVLTRRPFWIRSFVQWMLQDVVRRDPARAELSVQWATVTYRYFKPRRMIGGTALSDGDLAVRPPTLFLVGEHEKIYSAAKAVERLHRVAPQIRTQIVPEAGHDLTIAQPETIHRAVLDFLGDAAAAVP